jgi:hypothetical protein
MDKMICISTDQRLTCNAGANKDHGTLWLRRGRRTGRRRCKQNG